MSKADIDVTMERIAAATRESTIAVFNYPKTKSGKQSKFKSGFFDVVFGQTIKSQREIRNSPLLVGEFHREMDAISVRTKLNLALELQEIETEAHS